MNFLEDELAKTRNKSVGTLAETRCDSCLQMAEMGDKFNAKYYKSEEMRHSRRQQAAEIIYEEKEKVDKVRRVSSKNMDEKMAYMEENSAEMRRFSCCKMADMEKKAAEMAHEMREKPAALNYK